MLIFLKVLLQLGRVADKQMQIESVLAVLIPDLAEHFLLLHALDISVSPEPATWGLVLLGFFALGVGKLKQRTDEGKA